MRQVYPHVPLLFNLVLEFLARAIRQEEKIKCMQIVKEELKTIPTMPKGPENIKKLLDISKEAGYKINLQNESPFYTSTMNRLRKNIAKHFHLQ
jgi:3-methyladenine DNA glycosylase Mpg